MTSTAPTLSTPSSSDAFQDSSSRIALVGAGTIGLSFAALHLPFLSSPSQLSIYDTRPDIVAFSQQSLRTFLPSSQHHLIDGIKYPTDLASAVADATVVQEQLPENVALKQKVWAEIEEHAPTSALLWSSTSGVPASVMSAAMKEKGRVIVVHPYNPPHVMPLLEVVPSPGTSQAVVDATMSFWRQRGREPVLVKKEVKGFVANRLALALFREAIHLVKEGVVGVEDLDKVVESSMGPRWAVKGPFGSYAMGGGEKGLEGLMANVGRTLQAVWDDLGTPSIGDGQGWEEKLFGDVREAYGDIGKSAEAVTARDRTTRRVLDVVKEEKSKK